MKKVFLLIFAMLQAGCDEDHSHLPHPAVLSAFDQEDENVARLTLSIINLDRRLQKLEAKPIKVKK